MLATDCLSIKAAARQPPLTSGRAEGTPMRTPASLLRTNKDGPSPAPLVAGDEHAGGEQQEVISVDSDTVVILASLLCALICVAGLALVARCTCRRPRQGSSSSSGTAAAHVAPRGLKKAAIDALLPTVSLGGGGHDGERECAICLAVFAEGDKLRVLPSCGHSFHAACIDTWLAAHASCPSCRAVVVTCRRCGAACGDLIAVAAAAGGPEHPPRPLHPSLTPEGEDAHAIELVIH